MRRPALAALIIILPLTLGFRSTQLHERRIDDRRLTGDALARLASEGWSVRSSQHKAVGWLIAGERNDCRILVHFPAPSGEGDEKFRSLARSVGPVSYHYRRETSREFPRLVPMLAWHLQRYAWSFGVAVPTSPLIAIAHSPSCKDKAPEFTELRQRLQVQHPGG